MFRVWTKIKFCIQGRATLGCLSESFQNCCKYARRVFPASIVTTIQGTRVWSLEFAVFKVEKGKEVLDKAIVSLIREHTLKLFKVGSRRESLSVILHGNDAQMPPPNPVLRSILDCATYRTVTTWACRSFVRVPQGVLFRRLTLQCPFLHARRVFAPQVSASVSCPLRQLVSHSPRSFTILAGV